MTTCTRSAKDGCAKDPMLGTCPACGYTIHDIPTDTDNAHDDLCCGALICATPGDCYTAHPATAMVTSAQVDAMRGAMVDALPTWFPSMGYLAREQGLVPHGECIGHCTVMHRALTNAATLIAWEYRRRNLPQQGARWHTTAWQMARPVDGHLPA